MAPARPLLVLVTGPPASGKTTIAAELARQLQIPAFHKDDIKEQLAEVITGESLAWSQRLGHAAYLLMYQIGAALIEAGCSCLLEANFHPELSMPGLQPLALGADVVQVVCSGDPALLQARYLARHAAGTRHPVHLDGEPARSTQLEASFRRDHQLDLRGLTLRYDTTGEQRVDPSEIVLRINLWRQRGTRAVEASD